MNQIGSPRICMCIYIYIYIDIDLGYCCKNNANIHRIRGLSEGAIFKVDKVCVYICTYIYIYIFVTLRDCPYRICGDGTWMLWKNCLPPLSLALARVSSSSRTKCVVALDYYIGFGHMTWEILPRPREILPAYSFCWVG